MIKAFSPMIVHSVVGDCVWEFDRHLNITSNFAIDQCEHQANCYAHCSDFPLQYCFHAPDNCVLHQKELSTTFGYFIKVPIVKQLQNIFGGEHFNLTQGETQGATQAETLSLLHVIKVQQLIMAKLKYFPWGQ